MAQHPWNLSFVRMGAKLGTLNLNIPHEDTPVSIRNEEISELISLSDRRFLKKVAVQSL
jgi:hypothetical protein